MTDRFTNEEIGRLRFLAMDTLQKEPDRALFRKVESLIAKLDCQVGMLKYNCRELIGVIGEYKDMPCDSLERRMFAQAERSSFFVNRIDDND